VVYPINPYGLFMTLFYWHDLQKLFWALQLRDRHVFPLKKPFPHIFLWFALKILETLGLRTWPGLGTRWDRGPPGTAPQRQEHWGSLEPTATKVCSYSKGLPVVFVLQYNPIHLFCLLIFFIFTNKQTYIHTCIALHCITLHCTTLHYYISLH